MLPPGEESKSVEQLSALYDWALALDVEGTPVDRGTPVLALGGGVVGDLAGFLAATLLRGVPLVQLPTTVIAQADSAIGGKTGINHPAGKNLIGAFHQPRLVVMDPETLTTLPEREWMSGLAEVVKSALIADEAFVGWLEEHWEALVRRESLVATTAVARSAEIKAVVVAGDERESGRRAILNFGHTFGHAIERATGYGAFTHGEAVALGMRAALYLSYRLDPELQRARADALVARIGVPAGIEGLAPDALMDAMRFDKKQAAGRQRFVVLDRIGAARVAEGVPPELVEAAWAFLRGAAAGDCYDAPATLR
jgi:3-dehydroquinate synthase